MSEQTPKILVSQDLADRANRLRAEIVDWNAQIEADYEVTGFEPLAKITMRNGCRESLRATRRAIQAQIKASFRAIADRSKRDGSEPE